MKSFIEKNFGNIFYEHLEKEFNLMDETDEGYYCIKVFRDKDYNYWKLTCSENPYGYLINKKIEQVVPKEKVVTITVWEKYDETKVRE